MKGTVEYGQFCPVSKACEVIGGKWTILILRELLMGSTRFNELQRGSSLISPTILSLGEWGFRWAISSTLKDIATSNETMNNRGRTAFSDSIQLMGSA